MKLKLFLAPLVDDISIRVAICRDDPFKILFTRKHHNRFQPDNNQCNTIIHCTFWPINFVPVYSGSHESYKMFQIKVLLSKTRPL